MPDGLVFEVKGVPRAQPRGRHVGGHVVSTTGPARRFRLAVKEAATLAGLAAMPDGRGGIRPILCAVELVLVVRYPTKKPAMVGHWRTAIRDRDASNVVKLVEDAIVDAGVLGDDGQIARLGPMDQVWCLPGDEGVSVAIRALGARTGGARGVGGTVVAPEGARASQGRTGAFTDVPGWLG